MNARNFLRLLRAAWRDGVNNSLTERLIRAGADPNSLDGGVRTYVEGGAHPERDAPSASPRAGVLPQGVPRMTGPMVQVWHLLELIAGEKCQKVTGGSRCWDDPGSTPDCPWGADRWCDACTAQVALDALTPNAPSTPVSSPGVEVTPSTASRGAQATAAVEGVPLPVIDGIGRRGVARRPQLITATRESTNGHTLARMSTRTR